MSREDIASLVRTDSEPLTSRIEPLKDENKVLKDENKGLKDENKGLKRKVRGLEDQITIFKEECGEREARFQEVQHEALTRSKNDGFDALPDDVVKDELKNIFARGRHWAKNYAIPVSSMSEDVKKGIRVMLRGPENKESASLDGYQAACDGRINTRHVLTAMVARELAYHLFHRPFFYFQNNKQRSRQSTEKQLLSVQKMGTDSGEKMQHQWRAMTVRMLGAQKHNAMAQAGDGGHTHLQKLKSDAYAALTSRIIRSGEMLLRDTNEEGKRARSAGLIALFERAGDLACQLHGQYVKVRVAFSARELGAFSVDSSIMEAHTTMDIEQDDHGWDGQRVDLVLQPAIMGYGDERGENYDQSKVWSKAVVYMTGNRRPKTGATDFKPDRAKSTDGFYTQRIASAPKVAIVVEDDEGKHSQRQATEDNQKDVNGKEERKRPEESCNLKQATTTSWQFGRQEKAEASQAAQRTLGKKVDGLKSQAFMALNGKSSNSKTGGECHAEAARTPFIIYQSQEAGASDLAPETHARTMAEEAESPRRWGQSDKEDRSGPECRKKRRVGEQQGDEQVDRPSAEAVGGADNQPPREDACQKQEARSTQTVRQVVVEVPAAVSYRSYHRAKGPDSDRIKE